jgi:hypothetical protein
MHVIVSLPGARPEKFKETLYLAGVLRLRLLLRYAVVPEFTENVGKAQKRVTGVSGAVWVEVS